MKYQLTTYRRHSDGLKDSVKKLIASLKEWIAKFKELDVGQATIVIMSKLLQAASAILAAKNAIELKKHLKALSYWGERIKKVQEKDPNFIPSKENLYFQHKAKAIFKGISVITNLVGFVLSRYAEKNIMSKVENNTQKKSIQAHDSKYLMNKRDSSKRHNDDLIHTALGVLLSAGLGIGIRKAIEFATKKASGGSVIANEEEVLKRIRSGELTEQGYVREMKIYINRVMDNLYRQNEFDDFFEQNNINPSQETAIMRKIRSDINRCTTIQDIINILNSSSSPMASSCFYKLEPMQKLFKKAKTMRDSRFDDKRYNDFDIKEALGSVKEKAVELKKELISWSKKHPEATRNIKRLLKVLSAIIVRSSTKKFALNNGKTEQDWDSYKRIKKDLENGIIEYEQQSDGSYAPVELPSKTKIGLRLLVGLLGKIASIGLVGSAIMQKKEKRNKKDSLVFHKDFDVKEAAKELKAKIDKAVQYLKIKLADHPGVSGMISTLLKINAVLTGLYGGFTQFQAVSGTLSNLFDMANRKYQRYSWPAIIGTYLRANIFGLFSKFSTKAAQSLDLNVENRIKEKKLQKKLERMGQMTTHDQMPWVRKDAGVKGMKKGQHIKARDPEYKASLQGGGAASSSNPAKPSIPAAKQGNNKHGKAKAIAKMLAAAAGIAGAGYLGAKAMKKMRNRWGNQNSSSPSSPNSSGPKITQKTNKVTISPSKGPKPSLPSSPSGNSSSNKNIFQMGKYNIANREEFNKAMNDPDFKFEF